jgi:hypothetical protein
MWTAFWSLVKQWSVSWGVGFAQSASILAVFPKVLQGAKEKCKIRKWTRIPPQAKHRSGRGLNMNEYLNLKVCGVAIFSPIRNCSIDLKNPLQDLSHRL